MITTTNHETHWTAHAPALDWTEVGPTETIAVQRLRLRAARKLVTVREQIVSLFEALDGLAGAPDLSVRIAGDRLRVSVGDEDGEGPGLISATTDLLRRLDAQLSPLLCVAGHVVVAP